MAGPTHAPFLGRLDVDRAPEWERESGVIAVYEAAPRPSWTTDPPTHVGLWFVRLPGHSAKVVEVFNRDGTLYYGWTDIDWKPVPRTGLEWSDRAIVEPRE